MTLECHGDFVNMTGWRSACSSGGVKVEGTRGVFFSTKDGVSVFMIYLSRSLCQMYQFCPHLAD